MVSLPRTLLAARTLQVLVQQLTTSTRSTSRAFPVAPTRSFPDGSRFRFTLLARPPPIDSFDLAEIEKYEEYLDRAQPQLDIEDDDGEEDLEILDSEQNTPQTALDFTIPLALNNKRIDAALTALLEKSRSFCGALISSGLVRINDEVVHRKSFKVTTDQAVRVLVPHPPPVTVIPENVHLDILYEDEYMMVINKQPNVVVHPGAGNWNGTIVNGLAHYLQHSDYGPGNVLDETDSLRPGIVHRLDKGTTGVLVVAKTQAIQSKLKQEFAGRKVKKAYLAIVVGNPGEEVLVDNHISRHPLHRQRMRVVPNDTPGVGKRAVSRITTLGYDHQISLVCVQIKTGRTHQIRVHLQHLSTPVYGDDIYGVPGWNKRHPTDRPLLHAYKLQLEHPMTGESMLFQAPLPDDMRMLALQLYPDGPTKLASAFSGA